MLTAIPAKIDPRHLARDFALTNRLRIERARNLYEAAQDAGAVRIVAQSLACAYGPAGGAGPADEDAPPWQRPPKQCVPVLDAPREREARTADNAPPAALTRNWRPHHATWRDGFAAELTGAVTTH